MLKDIEFHHPAHTGIAIVPEEFPEETVWVVYFINYGPENLQNVLINSFGYGEKEGKKVRTSTLRWFLGDVESNQWVKVEDMQNDVTTLTNEFWLSYYLDGKIYDKKYIFVLDSINPVMLTEIPELQMKGVLIK